MGIEIEHDRALIQGLRDEVARLTAAHEALVRERDTLDGLLERLAMSDWTATSSDKVTVPRGVWADVMRSLAARVAALEGGVA